MKIIKLLLWVLLFGGCTNVEQKNAQEEAQVSDFGFGWKEVAHAGQKYYLYTCESAYLQLFPVFAGEGELDNRQRNLIVTFKSKGLPALDVIETIKVNGNHIEFIISAISQETYGAEPVDGFYPLNPANSIELSFSSKTEGCSIPSIFLKK
jgi:hypothetical protein